MKNQRFIISFSNPVTVTDAGCGSVDKYYIHTRLDHALGPDLQKRKISVAGITQVYSLNPGQTGPLFGNAGSWFLASGPGLVQAVFRE